MYLLARGYHKDKVEKYLKGMNAKINSSKSEIKFSTDDEKFFHDGGK